jgi:hypothetical protein
LRFREKGGKTIWKPVPAELAQLLDAAIAAGVYESGSVREVTRRIPSLERCFGLDSHPTPMLTSSRPTNPNAERGTGTTGLCGAPSGPSLTVQE